jgi:hypothetical protein
MRNLFYSFITGLLLGIALTLHGLSCTNKPTTPAAPGPSPKVIVKELSDAEKNYSKRADSLHTQSLKLQLQLTATIGELEVAKQRVKTLQQTVKDLIQKSSVNSNAVSNPVITPCDSLAFAADQLIESSNKKDSLYEQQAVSLELQVGNRDSVIALKTAQYTDIKSAFTKALDLQSTITTQNKDLNRQLRRQKFKSKLLTAAMLILSGAAANYMIHH